MSRWLNQVNHLLEKLDGQVETVASATGTTSIIGEDQYDDNTEAVDSNTTNTTTGSAVTAAVSVSRAAAVLGSNFVQKATAIAANNANRFVSLKADTNDDDNDEEYYDDEDEGEDYEEEYEEEEHDDDEEEYEDSNEVYEDEIDFDDDDAYATTPLEIPSILPQELPKNKVEPNQNDGVTSKQARNNETNEVLDDQNQNVMGTDDHQGVSLPSPEVLSIPKVVSDTTSPATGVTIPISVPNQNDNTDIESSPSSSSIPGVVLGTNANIVEPLNMPLPTCARISIDQQQEQQHHQQQLKSLNEQHSSELAQLMQQNETAIQQVIRQNEIDIMKIKEQNEKEQKRRQQLYDQERKQLQQQNERMQLEVQSLQKELQAVNQELHDAAQLVERERAATKLERQDILEEQEDELLHMKDDYEAKMQQLRNEIKDLKQQHETQLIESKEERLQLGDTLEEELQLMTEQYDESQTKIESLQNEKESVQKELQEWKDRYTTLETNFLNATERLSIADAAIVAAEERYDRANEQHRQQSQQRLSREAELEQTIAQLMISQQQQQASSGIQNNLSGSEIKFDTEEKQRMNAMIADLRGQYQVAMEEIETTKTDLAAAMQQKVALEQELQEYVQERQQDVEIAQRMQQEYEKQIQKLGQQLEDYKQHDLTSSNSAIGSNVSEHLQKLQRELYESNERMVSLSDQLLRQQTVLDAQKSEISALKSRLKAAITRAETAEAQQPVSSMEIELGRAPAAHDIARSSAVVANDPLLSKRRVKVGSSHPGPHRSIRAALGLQQPSIGSSSQRPRGPRLRSGTKTNLPQQIGITIDAIDAWMIDTGHVLRQEPWARLGFAVYFGLIHLFCFTLVAFHTIEVEHGDLGQLTDRSRVIGLRHHHYSHT